MERNNKKKYLRIFALLILIVFLFAAFDVRLKMVHYVIESDKIHSPLRLALVTDLHSCKYGEGQKTLINAVNSEEPDIVLLGGDIFDDEIPDDNTKIFLQAISNKYPIYYVTGNHEYWSRRVDGMLDWLRENNIEVLDGKTSKININGQTISLSGVDDPDVKRFTDKEKDFYDQLEEVGKNKNDGLFTILLAHRPAFVDEYLKYNFDLILCGHAHGGQWRIPYILNGFFAPDEGWLPSYAGGLYNFDHSQMIVSRGLARESTRVPRIFNRPELVIIELKKK